MFFLKGLLGLGWLGDVWGILGSLGISIEFYGYLGLCGKAPSLTSSFLAFPSQDLPGANVLSIFFPFYRGKPLQNRSAPHFIEGLPSCPITGAHAFLFYRGNPLQNRSAPHFIEGLPSCPITGAHAFLFYRGNPLQNRSVPHFLERLSEFFLFFKQYIQIVFKIFNALGCVARFHPGLGDFSPLITSIK